MTPLLSSESLSKSYGPQILFQKIFVNIRQGDRIGLIGPNGSGKSTLLKLLAGLDKPDSGTISTKQSLRVGYVPQDSIFPDKSLEEILLASFPKHPGAHEYEHQVTVNIILGKLGFENPSQSAQTLSGGWKKRLAIANELVKEPDILLLDEPTNHLDLEGILWLENFLLDSSFAYVVISHDRLFLENVTNRMMELNKTYANGIFAIDGNYSNFLEKRDLFLSGQSQYERSLASKARREIEWLKQNPKARTTKSTSRIQEAGILLKELADVKQRNKQSTASIQFDSTDRQIKKLLAATNVGKSIGSTTLFSGLTFTLSTGTRLGIVGANGSGKSTLIKILSGEIPADKGTIKPAEGLQIAYFDQHRAELPRDITLRRALAPESDRVNFRGQTIHVNSWCKRFLFSPDKLELSIGHLSGGERARILIARLMLQPADILLLDEPTNDLDIQTLEILEESLLDFPGAIVMISHDRMMLNTVCNTILGLGLPGENFLFADYAQWESYKNSIAAESPSKPQQKKEASKERQTPQPKKLTYKEKLELEKMEQAILAAENELATAQEQVNAPAIANEPTKLEDACNRLHTAQDKLDHLYHRWQELEAKQSL